VHAGVVVDDLATVVDFVTALGLDCGEPVTVGGEWVERIIDLPDPQVEARDGPPPRKAPTRSNS
jgi:hypothetical protein